MPLRKNVLKRHIARAINHIDSAGTQVQICIEMVEDAPQYADELTELLTGLYLTRQWFVTLWQQWWGVVPEDFTSYL